MSRDWPLILSAGFALIWIFHRASVQSITLDEANTFLRWVAPNSPSHWEPNSNNHVLNSGLIRLSIWLFGLGHITMRLPALLGGALYIVANSRLCTLVAKRGLLRWAMFVCLVYNPFIMDYLVASRGYGLALGFLSLAVYLFASTLIEEQGQADGSKARWRAAGISTCVGLSICASFPFAYASGFLLLVAVSLAGISWAARERGVLGLGRLVGAHLFPAAVVLLVLAGSALTQFRRDELTWGSDSLAVSWKDIREASFLELNPYLVNPLLANILDAFKDRVLQAMAAFGTGYIILLLAARRHLGTSPARPRLMLAGSLTLVLVLTVLACWLQFKLMGIPLPLERTSIFVVPLATVLVGAAVAALPFGSPAPFRTMALAVRGVGIAVLSISGVFFIGEIRDSHFREWKEGADVRAAFPVILDLCSRLGVRQVASDPDRTSGLKFYRAANKAEDQVEFVYSEVMPADKTIYVMLENRYGEFMRKENLQVAWRGPGTPLVVLIRPKPSGAGGR